MVLKVIKINYNFVAFLIGICLVAVFCFIELAFPQSLKEDVKGVNAESDTVSLPVVMYHHILKSPDRLGDYVISPQQFEEDLKYIQKCGYQTISSQELMDFIQNGVPLPEKAIMITFDDGYESVHEYAFPLLQKYNMKAVVSIIGKHTDIFSNPNEPRSINYSHLSWDQLREMQQSGVFEIENHSYDMHGNRGDKRYGIRIKKEETLEEYKKALTDDIGGLSEQIINEIGVKPTIFAYPFGALCAESKPILTDMGFQIILTCEEKVNKISPFTETPIALKRFNRASKYNTYDFFKKLEVKA